MQRKGHPAKSWNRKAYAVMCVVGAVIFVAWLIGRGGLSPKDNEKVENQIASPKVEGIELSERTAGGVHIGIGKARLRLDSSNNKDTIRVIFDKSQAQMGEEITYEYEWSINGSPAGSGQDNVSGFKRGDTVSVKITPVAGDKSGSSRLLTMEISNSPPKVHDGKELMYDGKSFSYQVVASDPDGDGLSYALANSPPGMTIDGKTGIVNWQLKEGDYGKRTVEVIVSDAGGAKTTYPLELNLQKPEKDKQPETRRNNSQ